LLALHLGKFSFAWLHSKEQMRDIIHKILMKLRKIVALTKSSYFAPVPTPGLQNIWIFNTPDFLEIVQCHQGYIL